MKRNPCTVRLTVRSAFTLVELLIVVAIIGILSAIAVPNFMSAQTRAKVSSTMQDLRALGTALKTYHIDSNAFPPGLNTFMHAEVITQTWRLTTPLAYISQIPEDSFYAPQPFEKLGGEFGPGGRYMHYMSDPVITETWLLWSFGPDKDMEFLQVDYDPSNGTVSDGDIYHVGDMQ